jgi:hypothetical protein
VELRPFGVVASFALQPIPETSNKPVAKKALRMRGISGWNRFLSIAFE